jgi:hypothetical protein
MPPVARVKLASQNFFPWCKKLKAWYDKPGQRTLNGSLGETTFGPFGARQKWALPQF